MRNAGGNLTIRDQLQAYSRLLVHAIPHPALRATFPPGEGKGAAAPEQPTVLRIYCQVAGGRKALPYEYIGTINYNSTEIHLLTI